MSDEFPSKKIRDCLEGMQYTIKHVSAHGHTEGSLPVWPTGITGS